MAVTKNNFNKKTLIDNLSDVQKLALNSILGKLEKGIKIKKSDLEIFTNFENCSSGEICKVFGLARASLMSLVQQYPIIKNSDGSYNLIRIVDVYRNKEKIEEQASSQEKNYWQIKRLKFEIEQLEKSTISKELHEKILESMARGLNTFLTQSSKMNLHVFENKSINELRILFEEYNKEMIDAFLDSKVKQEDDK